jgi:hypothetical protein
MALNRSIILKYMYEIVMAATSHPTYYHKVTYSLSTDRLLDINVTKSVHSTL